MVTPAWPERQRAGVGLHISSLPGPYGIGDLGREAMAFVDALAGMGLGVWQFLPLGPTAYGNSPYQSLSAFAGNELLLGIEPLLAEGLLRDTELDALRDLPRGRVDFARLIPAKAAVLGRASERFHASADGATRAAYDDFLERHDASWLADYALFRVLKSVHGERSWREWEAEFRNRETAALRRARDRYRDAVEHIRVIQFLFHRQWQRLAAYAAERGVRLFGDMPIYIAWDSSDAWSRPDLLQLDATGRPARIAGVPPDYFSATGQLWGNPLYDWDRHAAEGFGWWIERIGHAAAQSDLVRIDHFRGFESYWSVPHWAEDARLGEWRPGPRDALFEAVESALGRLPIVAEDLGVITKAVEALRRRHGIPGMIVLQFALGERDFAIADVEEQCVCYTGTHDNDTTIGWFHGGDYEVRSPKQAKRARKRALEMTGGSPRTIHLDFIRLAFSTPARVAMAPMQDYLGLGSEARFNLPGSTRDNWRWRLGGSELTPRLRDTVGELVASAGRDA